jgi:hypothetical protein
MPLFKRVDQLPAATGVTGSDFLILSRPSGPTGTVGTRAATLSQLLTFLNTNGGATGPTGSAGVPGAASTVTGPAGASVTGPTGVAGSQGERGDTGPAGVAGSNGSAGAAGERGDTGPTGAVGSQGPQGDAGAASTVTGPTGASGVAGSNGAAGEQGATGPAYQTTVTGVSLSGTGTYNPLTLDGAFDVYYLTLATGAAIQALSITGPTGTTKQFLVIGTTGAATFNHATGANANAQFAVPWAGSVVAPVNGGNVVAQYDGTQWRVI